MLQIGEAAARLRVQLGIGGDGNIEIGQTPQRLDQFDCRWIGIAGPAVGICNRVAAQRDDAADTRRVKLAGDFEDPRGIGIGAG